MKILYQLFIILYSFFARILAFFNPKAKLWVDGRKQIFNKLALSFENNTNKVVWVHCASLGEFEQGRPIIEKLKKENTEIKILLTFFSPSGYEIQRKYEYADWVFYLPIDTKSNAEKFYTIVNPTLIIFIKYEFWYYYLFEAKKRYISLILVSGIFRNNQPFFKWYGSLHREMLQSFTHFFIQGQLSYDVLTSIYKKHNISICGDTRFDRVLEIANESYENSLIENFIQHSKVVVAGSTWYEDDLIIDHFANSHPKIKFIIAPHEINEDRLTECLTFYKNAVLLSQLEESVRNFNVLIIDNIGILSKLYRYGTVCYIGGGFGGDGVHNILEAAVYNKPVVFGPVYEKYREAVEMVDSNAAISIKSAIELEKVLDKLMNDEHLRNDFSSKADLYIKNNIGASQKIVDFIYANRLLTN